MRCISHILIIMNTPIIIFNFGETPITDEDCNNLSTITVNQASLEENLNSKQLNENKFFGTISTYFTTYDVIIVPAEHGNSFINKGTNRLVNDLKWRLKLNKTFNPSIVAMDLPDNSSVWYTKDNNCVQCKGIDELRILMAKVVCNVEKITFGGNVTCGFICKTNDGRVGHITVAYNVTQDASNELLVNNGVKYVGSTVSGIEISFSTISGSKISHGGSVISLPSLILEGVAIPHITCNTTIKSVLSSKIVAQYNESKFEFPLSDIDPNCKQPTIIHIMENTEDIDVNIVSWYCYYLN